LLLPSANGLPAIRLSPISKPAGLLEEPIAHLKAKLRF